MSLSRMLEDWIRQAQEDAIRANGGNPVGPGGSSAVLGGDADVSSSAASKLQYAVIYDLISEGPIEGLVTGPASAYLNGASMVSEEDYAEKGAVGGKGQQILGTITGGTSSLALSGDDFVENSDTDLSRHILIEGAGKSTGSIQFTLSANSREITTNSPFFEDNMVSSFEKDAGNFVGGEQIQIITDSGEYFYSYIGLVNSSTSAILYTVPSFGGTFSGSDVVMNYTSFTYSTLGSTVTLEHNVTSSVTDANVLIGTASSVTDSLISDWNYEGASLNFQLGTYEQDYVTAASQTAAASYLYSQPTALKQHSDFGGSAGSIIITPSLMNIANPSDIDKFKISIEGSSLISTSGNTGREYPQPVEIQVLFRYKTGGSPDTFSDDLVMIGRSSPSATDPGGPGYWRFMTKKPYLKEFRFHVEHLQPFTDWELEIKKVTPDSGEQEQYSQQKDIQVKGVHAQVLDRLNYRGSAYATVSYSAKDFANPPTRTYEVRGKRIQVPTNYITREENDGLNALYKRNVSTGATESTEQDWDGNFRGDPTASTKLNRQLVYSNNPAWVFYDILMNKVYGLGEYIDTDLIDKYSLYQIAQYCDELVPDGSGGLEPRFTTNVYIQSQQEAYKVLKDLATVFRGILYWLNGEVVAIQDSFKEPVYTFTQGNVINGLFTYEGQSDRVTRNRVNVTWRDPQNHYKQDVLVVDDLDSIADKGAILAESIVAFGCTSRGQAYRAGKWYLETNARENEIVKFETGSNGSFILPGDIINVQDQERSFVQYSGRLSAAQDDGSSSPTPDANTIHLDREVSLVAGSAYTLHVYFAGGAAYLVQEAPATVNSITYEKGQIITGITSKEDATDATDDSGNRIQVYWSDKGHIKSAAVDESSSSGNIIELTTGFSSTPESNAIWALSTDAAGGSPEDYDDTNFKQYRVLGIEEKEEGEYAIIASLYDGTKYTLVDYGYPSRDTLNTEDPTYIPNFVPKPVDLGLTYSFSGATGDGSQAEEDTNEAVLTSAVASWGRPEEKEPTVGDQISPSATARTTLSSFYSVGSQANIPVTSSSGFSSTGGIVAILNPNGRVREFIAYTGTTTGGLTGVTRGYYATPRALHHTGATVVDLDYEIISYRFISHFEVKLDDGQIYTTYSNTFTFPGLPEGTYELFVRTVSTNGAKSAWASRNKTIATEKNRQKAIRDRVSDFGAIDRIPTIDSSTGEVTISPAAYSIKNPLGEYTTVGSVTTLDFSSMANGDTAYVYFDHSDGILKEAETVTDNSWYISSLSAASSPFVYGSATWWSPLSDANNGLTAATGTGTIVENTSRIVGTGTSFTTEFSVGDLVRLSTVNTPGTFTTDAWYSRVESIESDTSMYTTDVATKVFAHGYIFRQELAPQSDKDLIISRVTRQAGSPNYTLENLALTNATDGVDGAAGQDAQVVKLTADSYVAAYDGTGSLITASPGNNITLTATASGSLISPSSVFRFIEVTSSPDVVKQDWSATNTYTIPETDLPSPGSPASIQYRVEATNNASPYTYEAFDTITIFSVQDGAAGSPGASAQGIRQVNLYKLNDSTLTDNTQGTYANPQSGLESGWEYSIPSISSDGDQVYVITRTFTDDAGSPQDATWSGPSIYSERTDGQAGSPGETGQASRFPSIYRLNSNSINTTAGTFSDPLAGNSSWSFSVPSLASDGDVVYISTRLFTDDGGSPQDSSWATPTIYSQRTDGAAGSPGADGRPGLSGTGTILIYDEARAGTESMTTLGNYKFSNSSNPSAGGTLTWSDITGGTYVTHIHLNDSDDFGVDQSVYLAQITSGDIITWYESDRRWVEFRVTSTPSESGGIFTFPVSLVEFDEEDGNQDLGGSPNHQKEFRFSRASAGADGRPGLPGASILLDYNDLAFGISAGNDGSGVYAFSTGTGAGSPFQHTNLWSTITTAGGVDQIVLSRRDTSGTINSDKLEQVEVGDHITWYESDGRWVEFEVTVIRGLGYDETNYFSFDVSLVEFDETDGSGDIGGSPSQPVVFRISRASESVTGFLTNEAHVEAATSFGSLIDDLTDAGGTFKVYQGATDVTTSATFSVESPATVDGLTMSINSSGVYSLSGTWTGDVATFDLTAVYGYVTNTRTYSIAKSREGEGLLTDPVSASSDGSVGDLEERIVFLDDSAVEYYAWEDNTNVYVRDAAESTYTAAVSSASAGDNGTISVTAGQRIISNKPVSYHTNLTNLPTLAYASTQFVASIYRAGGYSYKTFRVFAPYSDATVEIWFGGTAEIGDSPVTTSFTATYNSFTEHEYNNSGESNSDDARFVVRASAPIILAMSQATSTGQAFNGGIDECIVIPPTNRALMPFRENPVIAKLDPNGTVTSTQVTSPTNASYHVSGDTLFFAASTADSDGSSEQHSIPQVWTADRYAVSIDLDYYQVFAIEPTVVRVYQVSDGSLYATHDFSAASETSPLVASNGTITGATILTDGAYFVGTGRFAVYVNPSASGVELIPHGWYSKLRTQAELDIPVVEFGNNIFNEAGVLLSDIDVANDKLVGSVLGGSMISNPSLDAIRAPDTAGNTNPRPIGWYYRGNAESEVNANGDTVTITTNGVGPQAGVLTSTAWRVNPRTSYEITIIASSTNTRPIGFYVYDTDVEISEYGAYAISDGYDADFTDPEIFNHSDVGSPGSVRNGATLRNGALTTSLVAYTATYTPASDTKYASVAFNVGGGSPAISENVTVDSVWVRDKSRSAAKTLSLSLNSDASGGSDSGQFALTAYGPDNTSDYGNDGFIVWEGNEVFVPREYSDGYTGHTSLLTGLRGFIAFDTSLGTPFTVNSVARDIAFVTKSGSQWFYDNNSTSVAFTPDSDIVAIGWLEKSSITGGLSAGGLFDPVTLTLAAFPAAQENTANGTNLVPVGLDTFGYQHSSSVIINNITYDAGNGSAALSTSVTLLDGQSLLYSHDDNGTGFDYVFLSSATSTYNIPVEEGKNYIFSAMVYPSADPAAVLRLRVRGQDTNYFIDAVQGSNDYKDYTTLTANSWQRVHGVFTAGTGHEAANLSFWLDNNGTNMTMYIDEVMFEEYSGNSSDPQPSTFTRSTGGINGVATNQNIDGQIFTSEDFGHNDITRADNLWDSVTGDGGSNVVTSVVAESTATGGYAYEIGDNSASDQFWRAVNRKWATPVSPGKVYRVSARLRRTAGANASVYFGVAGFKGDVRNGNGSLVNANGLNQMGSQHYSVSDPAPTIDEWQEYDYYWTADGAGSSAVTTNTGLIGDPDILHEDVEFISPILIANHSGEAGIYQLDYIKLQELAVDQTGATAGDTLYNEAGTILADIDVRNDEVVTDALNAMNYNASMQMPAYRGNVLGPSSYITNSSSGGSATYPTYENLLVRDVMEWNGSSTLNMAALPVTADAVYEISALVRIDSGTTENLDLRVEALAGNMPTTKQYIGSGSTAYGMQARTTLYTLVDNQAIGTTYELISGFYEPSGNEKWFSPSMYANGSSGSNFLVEWWVVRQMSKKPDRWTGSSLVRNSSLMEVETDSDGNQKPVGWYRRTSTSSATLGDGFYYQSTSNVRDIFVMEVGAGGLAHTMTLNSEAIRHLPGKTYEVIIRAQQTVGTSNLDVRALHSTSSDLGTGISAINRWASGTYDAELSTSGGTATSATSINTTGSFATYTVDIDDIPDNATYFSIVLSSGGSNNTYRFQQIAIREKAPTAVVPPGPIAFTVDNTDNIGLRSNVNTNYTYNSSGTYTYINGGTLGAAYPWADSEFIVERAGVEVARLTFRNLGYVGRDSTNARYSNRANSYWRDFSGSTTGYAYTDFTVTINGVTVTDYWSRTSPTYSTNFEQIQNYDGIANASPDDDEFSFIYKITVTHNPSGAYGEQTIGNITVNNKAPFAGGSKA